MDRECTELYNAMNEIPGIRTVESCCGHGKDNYRIWFFTKGLRYLPRLLYWFNGCHCGFYGWKCFVKTDCAMSPAFFCIEGPIGDQAYEESKKIALLLIRKGKRNA